MNEQEKVLVVKRELFDECGAFQGLEFDVERYSSRLLHSDNYWFEPRATAEEDESLKQIIPYFIITHAGRVWCYVRGKKSGEGRLVSKASIGVGGHINDEDEEHPADTYRSGAERELNEEVSLPAGWTDRIVAILNDDSNPVGRVHLGVVHVLEVPSDAVSSNETELQETSFKTIDELRDMYDIMETWSQKCIDQIETLLA
jgi:predicted NUDIX family phosphoesterase